MTRKTAAIVAATAATMALGSVGCTADSGSEEAFCRQVKDLPPLDSVITGFSEADPAELAERLESAAASYAELRDAAPGEIRESVRAVVDLVDAVIEGVGRNPDDPEATADELRAAVVDHPGAPLAAARVVDYAQEHCDLQLDPSLDEEGPTTPGAAGSTTTAVPDRGTATSAPG